VVVVNKVDTAPREAVEEVKRHVRHLNPQAVLVEAASPIRVDRPDLVVGRRVVVVEDGPTVTHGEMPYGAGLLAARKLGAVVVDPRPYAVGSLQQVFRDYPHLTQVLPAMGYGGVQLRELEQTLLRAEADAVVVGTPVDLRRLLHLDKPAVKVSYELEEVSSPTLAELLRTWLAEWEARRPR
jgi:predicted GTPase